MRVFSAWRTLLVRAESAALRIIDQEHLRLQERMLEFITALTDEQCERILRAGHLFSVRKQQWADVREVLTQIALNMQFDHELAALEASLPESGPTLPNFNFEDLE